MPSPTIQPTKFDIEAIRVGPEHAVLIVAGEVDLASIDRLQHHLSKLLTGGVRFLVADLSAVSFVSSIGLEAIVNTHDYTGAQGGWLILIDPPSIVTRLLTLVAPTKRFTSYRSAGQVNPGLRYRCTHEHLDDGVPAAEVDPEAQHGASGRAPQLRTQPTLLTLAS